jgi:hypothetical protein
LEYIFTPYIQAWKKLPKSHDFYFVKKVTKTLYPYVIYRVFVFICDKLMKICKNVISGWLTLRINPSESAETILGYKTCA